MSNLPIRDVAVVNADRASGADGRVEGARTAAAGRSLNLAPRAPSRPER